MKYREALMAALDSNEKMSACYDFLGIVEVVHQDGSKMTYANARMEWVDSVWIGIHTEHCGVQVFHSGDIKWVSNLKRESIFKGVDE